MQETNFLWPDAVKAIQAATWAAIEKARQTGTNLVVRNEDGKIVEITPDEAERNLHKKECQ
jgi:hypothetical protein